ncbi:hypothetical protein [Pedosphaera parvula]|nr:hypothetical protein [Pedosphaera parvula]
MKKFTSFPGISFQLDTRIKAFAKTIGLTLVVLFGSMAMSFGQAFPVMAGSAPATNSFTPVPNFGSLVIDYNFYTVPDTMDVYYNDVNIFSSGQVSGAGQFFIPYGPGSPTSLTIVMDQAGVVSPTTEWMYQVTAVPEPGCLWFLSLGLPLLVFCPRRISTPARCMFEGGKDWSSLAARGYSSGSR